MIDPELVKQYYAQLLNEQLVDLVSREKEILSPDALRILHLEMAKRGLNVDALTEYMQTKSLEGVQGTTQSTSWEFAFEERRKGASDAAVVHELVNRGVYRSQAYAIVKTLPDFDYQDQQFDELVLLRCQDESVGALFVILLVFVPSVFFLYLGIMIQLSQFFVIAVVAFVLAVRYALNMKSHFQSGETWLKIIKTNPEKIVWIRPVVESRKDFIFTRHEERLWLLTSDNRKKAITLVTEEEQQIFYEGVRHLLPHAQMGFTFQAKRLYALNPANFISALIMRGIYTPINKIRPLFQ
jgi:hypothetical protein